MAKETGSDDLPDKIRERVEIVEAAKLLRGDCVEILSKYGILKTTTGIRKIKKRVHNFFDHPLSGRTKEEILERHIYKTQ